MIFINTDFNIQRAIEIFSETSGISADKIDLNQPLEQLEIQSIAYVNIIIQFEAEYDIEFEPDAFIATKFNNVRDFFVYIENLCSNQQEGER